MKDALEVLMSQVEDRKQSIIESIADGSAKDFGAYQMSVGMVRGLLTVQGLIEDLAKRMEEFDE